MILACAEIQVLVATRPVDFRNYAVRTIMRSSRRDVSARRGFFVAFTPHNELRLCAALCATAQSLLD